MTTDGLVVYFLLLIVVYIVKIFCIQKCNNTKFYTLKKSGGVKTIAIEKVKAIQYLDL